MSRENPYDDPDGIVWGDDLPECDCCGEPWCPKHELHYADCSCKGPSSELFGDEED